MEYTNNILQRYALYTQRDGSVNVNVMLSRTRWAHNALWGDKLPANVMYGNCPREG